MKPKVYISVGSTSSPIQKRTEEIIFRSLETAGLSPRQMDKNEWTAEQPLRGIKRVIEQCHGIVVIAFRRYQFPTGIEQLKNGVEKQLADIRITTVWNQIEAAMGYTRGLPLLVIAENGLLDDGLLEGRYDWKVYWADFKPENFQSDDFIGYLESWKQLVVEHSESVSSQAIPNTDLSKISIGQLYGCLTIPQLWGAISAFIGCLISVAVASFKAGSGKWPWQ
jgi:hypothetical protein